MATMMHVWLAQDPETERITAQDREWSDGDFPPGPRGRGWPRREADIDENVWAALMLGEIPPSEQDELHQTWWNQE